MKNKLKIKILSIFALLLAAIFGSERAMANEDVYPFIWKNEYKYFVDPTFHTVKFCNDYKNVLCVSDSTIEILDAENGKSLRKKKYDFHIKFVRTSKHHSFVAVNFWGGNIGLIDLNTLELIKTIEIYPYVDDMCFTKDKLVITHNLDQEGKYLSIVDLLNYKLTKNDNIFYNSMIVYNEKQDLFYILDSYLGGGGSNNSRLYQFDLKSNKSIFLQSFEDFFKNLKLSPQENYLGFSKNYGGKLVVFDISDHQKPKEIKEIDFECFQFSFSYDEKYLMYDLSISATNPKTFLYDIQQLSIINKLKDNARSGAEYNNLNQCLIHSTTDEKDRILSLRPVNFLSSASNDHKKSSIEIKNNIIIFNFNDNRNISIIISDISGKELQKYILNIDNNKSIDLNFLERGMYLISLSSNDNIIETIKFIKE